MSNAFDFEEALKDLQAGKDLTGKDVLVKPNWTLSLENFHS